MLPSQLLRATFSLLGLWAGFTATDRLAAAPPIAGEPTRVLVLGSPHLGGLPKSVDLAWLAPLLDRLAAAKPDFIVIEGLSGEECDHLRRFESRYPDVAKDYCVDVTVAAKATGLSVPAAVAAYEKTLASWPAQPTAAQRRRLASEFAAAGERASALVQWLRLPVEERRAGDGLDDALVAELEKARGRANENYLIGSVLAARLGHERVYSIDDHTSDAITVKAGEALAEALQKVWRSAAGDALRAEEKAQLEAIKDGAGLLAHYRWLNTAAVFARYNAVDQDAALLDASPQRYGRQYVAWWETRNLRMVANLRAVAGARPGSRVLAIVGSSHKGPYERYLRMLNDVEVVGADEFLREPAR